MTRSSFGWQGDSLHTVVLEDGPCKQSLVARSTEVASITSTASPDPTVILHTGLGLSSTSSAAPMVEPPLPQSLLKFSQRKDKSQDRDEVIFCNLVLARQYEEAIEYASNLRDKNPILGGQLIIDLLDEREKLSINVNEMNKNPQEQTPLHKAAIRKQFYAYHAIKQGGGDSQVADKLGKTAKDYYDENLKGYDRIATEAMLKMRRYAATNALQSTRPNSALETAPTSTSRYFSNLPDRRREIFQAAERHLRERATALKTEPSLKGKDAAPTTALTGTSTTETKDDKKPVETLFDRFFNPSNKAAVKKIKPKVSKAFLYIGGTHTDRDNKSFKLSLDSKLKHHTYVNKDCSELAIIYCEQAFEYDVFTFEEAKALAGQDHITPRLTHGWFGEIVQSCGVIDLAPPEEQLTLSNLSFSKSE
jgi:hypothetical protein